MRSETTSGACFLSLPTEVRMLIYEEVVRSMEYGWEASGFISVTCVNRQIREESYTYLYQNYKPWIHLWDYLPMDSNGNPGILGDAPDDLNYDFNHCFFSKPSLNTPCISKICLETIFRFRQILLEVSIGPSFGTAKHYNALKSAMSRLHDGLRESHSKVDYKTHLRLLFSYCIPDYQAYENRATSILRSVDRSRLADTIGWMFEDLKDTVEVVVDHCNSVAHFAPLFDDYRDPDDGASGDAEEDPVVFMREGTLRDSDDEYDMEDNIFLLSAMRA